MLVDLPPMASDQPDLGDYLQRLRDALASIDPMQMERVVQLLAEVRRDDRRVFVVGNGGSATTASHMATDLGVGSHRFGCGVRALSLVDNTGVLTATANDISFEEVFAAQLRLLADKGDVLVAISASGNSPNVVRAVETAKELSMHTVGISGFDGGELAKSVDLSVHVATAQGDYGPVEDAHLAINHMVTEKLRQIAASEAQAEGDRG